MAVTGSIAPRLRYHALNGHRIPAQGANPGNQPGKTTPRSEGTPHSLRVSDLDPGLSYAVFLQNTPILWDVVPRANALGWYALPRWGKLNNGISIPRVSRISGCLTVLIVTALIAELRADETSALPGQKNVRPPETADGLETTRR